jgi:hypothetical protein
MPKSHTLNPADIATENAVRQWLKRCSYHLCDPNGKDLFPGPFPGDPEKSPLHIQSASLAAID